MDALIPAAVIFGLVALNGLFVAAEFAIVGVPRTTIEHQADRGHRGARRVRAILDNPQQQDRFIATAQIGITVASLGLGMYGEHALASWLEVRLAAWATHPWLAAHVIASIVAVTALTYVHIVLGEMVPKALALQYAARTVLWVTPIVVAIQHPLAPIVRALNGLGNLVLRSIGIERRQLSTERYHTTEELRFIIQESQEGGLLRGESGAILRELFEFGDLTAGEVMVPRVQVIGVQVGAEPGQLRDLVRNFPHTRYPVFAGDLDNIVGSLHIKDVLRHLVANQPVTSVEARPLPYLPGPARLDQVLAAMRREHAQMVVVMDQHGGTAGIVTIEDLFEEVVGEIEEGRGRAPIVRDSQGRLHVRGTVRLTEAGGALRLVLEHPKVTTVSGLVLALLGRPAAIGDSVSYGSVRIEVTAVTGRGVRDAIVTPLGPAEKGKR